MKIFDIFKNLFTKEPEYPIYYTGVIPNDEDYRDIDLPSVQQPLGGILPLSKPIPEALKNMPVLDQGQQPACVPHAIAQLLMYYIYRKFGKRVELSPRFAYRLCKALDGLPRTPGTKPRIAALVFTKYGCCTLEKLKNDVTLTQDEYLAVDLVQSLYEDAKANTLPGFASVPLSYKGVCDALNQNDVIVGSTLVGDWNILPLLFRPPQGWHYTLWCGYETMPSGKTKVFTKNSWGSGWLAWLKEWILPGYGWFILEDYIAAGAAMDVIAFTDIPREYLDYVKKAPYKFTKPLMLGANDPSVKELQKLLNESIDTSVALEGPGSPGEETTFFGKATQAALVKWQQKNHIDPIGVFGPLSMREANKRIPKMTLEQAVILVESGGSDNAIGDRNLTKKAYGAMQIRQPCVDDVNKKLGTQYKAEQCLGNRELSLLIFRTYISIYEPNGTDEEKSRLWNGGPGWRLKRSATDGYWSKIKSKLNS